VENASRFTEFLSSEAVAPISTSITIIPNIIKDILNVVLEHKQLKIQDKQFRRKAELAQQFLTLHDKHSQRLFQAEIEKVHTNANAIIADIEQRREVGLAQIESDKQVQLRKINAYERTQIKDIESHYKQEHQRLAAEKEMFQKALRESSKQFDRQMRRWEEAQAELTQLINVIKNKIVKGTANEYEYELLGKLSMFKIHALDKSFDISQGFLEMFSGG